MVGVQIQKQVNIAICCASHNARLCADPTVFRPNRILIQLSIGACHALSSAKLLADMLTKLGQRAALGKCHRKCRDIYAGGQTRRCRARESRCARGGHS